jgi:hypothetical protein
MAAVEVHAYFWSENQKVGICLHGNGHSDSLKLWNLFIGWVTVQTLNRSQHHKAVTKAAYDV